MKLREFVLTVNSLAKLEKTLDLQKLPIIELKSKHGNVYIKDYQHLRYSLWLLQRIDGYNKKQSNEIVDDLVKTDYQIEDGYISLEDFGPSLVIQNLEKSQIDQLQEWDYYFSWSKELS